MVPNPAEGRRVKGRSVFQLWPQKGHGDCAGCNLASLQEGNSPARWQRASRGVAMSLKQLSSERKKRRADKGVAREGRSSEGVLFCSFMWLKIRG